MNITKPLRVIPALLGALVAAHAAAMDTTAPREGPGAQAARDARAPEVLKTCPGGTPSRQGSPGINLPEPPANYQVEGIPGVIKAGERWKVVWETTGNNADGIIGLSNGNVLIPQNLNSAVVEITPEGKETVIYKDTNTGGALSMNKKGQLFIAQRGLRASIWQLAPERKMLANEVNGGSFDCLGGVLNDITADSKGGVYFTQGGVYYAAPDGKVKRVGGEVTAGGIVLSHDEKTMYMASRGAVLAFSVQPDGALINERTLAQLPGGGGDGMTIDANERLYVPGYPGVRVVASDGKVLGTIPAPAHLTSVTFGGPGKKTLYAVAQPVMPVSVKDGRRVYDENVRFVPRPQLIAISMEAQGYLDRPK